MEVGTSGKADRMSIFPQFEGKARHVFYQSFIAGFTQGKIFPGRFLFPQTCRPSARHFFLLLLILNLETDTFFQLVVEEIRL